MKPPIVVAVNGSDLDALAVDVAAELGHRFQRSILVLFVRHLPAVYRCVNPMVDIDFACLEESLDARELIARARSIATLDRSDFPWSFVTCAGNPVRELINAARRNGAGLLVATSLDEPERRRFGSSLTRKLVARWPHYTLVVSPAGRQMYLCGSLVTHEEDATRLDRLAI
jgi:nucleotide-binding universal stress UspA family protein